MSVAACSPVQWPAGSRVSLARPAGTCVVPGQPLVEQAEGNPDAAGDGGRGAVA